MTKKILVFLTHDMSLGSWSEAKILEREIYPFYKRVNYDFIFISYGLNDEKQYLAKYNNLNVYNLKRICINNCLFSRIFYPLFALLFDKELKKIVKESELFISNQMDGALLPAILNFFYKKKFILRTGFSLSFFNSKIRKNNIISKFLINLYEFICISLSTKYTISSKYEFSYIKNKFPFFIKKTFVVPNWIDTERFKPLPGILKDKISLISIGRLEKQKNPFDLILISKLSNIPLTIIGEGYLKPYLTDYINFLKAPVRILGRINNDDLPKILNNHSIYISTSLYEGSPKTVLEAMSCALITIAYSAPGIDEIISNNFNGFVVRPTPYIMKNVINSLINNKKKVDTIRHNSRRYVVENYSFKKIVKIQNNLYFN